MVRVKPLSNGTVQVHPVFLRSRVWAVGALQWPGGRDNKVQRGARRAAPSHTVLGQMPPVTTAVPREEKSLPRLQPSLLLVLLHSV